MRLAPLAADGDLAGLAALHAAAFDEAWDAAALAALLAAPGAFGFVALETDMAAGVLQGFVVARRAAGEAEIVTLAVAPHARRRGIGRALMQAACARAAELGAAAMFLEVGAENVAGLGLYRSLSFVSVGRRRAYYRHAVGAEDAAVLKAELPLRAQGQLD